MDDKSTPIESLNNKGDESEVVNQILSKYNNIQDGDGQLPPYNNNIPKMEEKFENRDLNNEIYNLNSSNDQYKKHYENEVQRTSKYNAPPEQDYEDEYEDEVEDQSEDEYEIIQVPLWKRVINEIRIPVFIFIFIIAFSNCYFDKFLIGKIPKFGNQFNECNTYGFLFKAFIISLISYIFIRFIRL